MRPTIGKRSFFALLVISLLTTVIAIQGSSIVEEKKDEVPQLKENSSAQKEASPLVEPKSSSNANNKEVSSGADATPKVDADKITEDEAIKRKSRSEPTFAGSSTSDASASSSSPPTTSNEPSKTAEPAKVAEKKAPEPSKMSTTPAKAKQQPSNSKGASKSKLPANLGTVTSTGSGGAAHYMSKHDAYSAIAEKHGALVQDAMKKSDKRRVHGFGSGGIQKASGFGDMFSPFKAAGLTDGGLTGTLGASMRSIMKSKFSVPAYVASALLGAVALMAFYESPISPLPVPALPEPPIGRFPPEMPNISPNVQVPFRVNQQQQQYGNQQQNYNQRSYMGQQQGPQQVLFPGAAQAQQRQMTSAGPVQQLAANLLSTVAGKQQVAQRKSGLDYDQTSSRSFFGSSSSSPTHKSSAQLQGASNQPKQNSIFSFFGIGGTNSPGSGSSNVQSNSSSANSNGERQGQSNQGIQKAAGSSSSQSSSSSSSSDSKGQKQSAFSNLPVIKGVRTFFNRTAEEYGTAGFGPTSQSAFRQMKWLMDKFFLIPMGSQLSETLRKPFVNSSPLAGTGIKTVNSFSPAPANPSPAARMSQVDGSAIANNNQVAKAKTSGLIRAADRIAHALLETFSLGTGRNVAQDSTVRKSVDDEQDHPSLASATTTLLSNFVSTYSAGSEPEQQHQQLKTTSSSSASHQQATKSTVTGRSIEGQTLVSDEHSEEKKLQEASNNNKQPAASSLPTNTNSQSDIAPQTPTTSLNNNIRKTRSVGFEYPIESNQELAQRDQQPSKAAQINNLVDFVADSYAQNRLIFNFVMNQVGLSQAVPYMEQYLTSGNDHH